MKKIYVAAVVLMLSLSFLALSGCDAIMGDDGNAYLQVTVGDSFVEYWAAYVEGFPSGWSLETNYAVTRGTHDIEYVLMFHEYDSGYWNYYFNSLPDQYVYYSYEESLSTAMSNFLNADYGAVCTGTVTIEVEEGDIFFEDGDDRFYTLTLDWYPEYTSVSYRGIELDKSVATDGNATVTTFTDGHMTFTLTVPKEAQAPTAEFNSAGSVVQ